MKTQSKFRKSQLELNAKYLAQSASPIPSIKQKFPIALANCIEVVRKILS